MVRKFALIVVSVILSLTLSSVAFADQSGSFVFYGNAQSGSVSDGQQGYSWYHSNPDQVGIDNHSFRNLIRDHEWNHAWNHDSNYNWNYGSDSERYFYVDDNGINHYFYLDSARDYDVHQYKDGNGNTQYWFEDLGWK